METDLLINADFASAASLTPNQYHWVNSPQAGVERVMLDRVGDEVARATSIVRYAPASSFPGHLHSGGEEILVLSGTFSDENGHYPAGWYLRNPPGSSHQPFSSDGATLFVKLGQMNSSDTSHVRIDTRPVSSWHLTDNGEVCHLFRSDHEHVSLQRLPPGKQLTQDGLNGIEILVLEGVAQMNDQSYPRGSWLRLPAGPTVTVYAGAQGLTCYLKSGHLGDIAPAALA
jgi:anti-sigma factor ChrR (cupin superfamily)